MNVQSILLQLKYWDSRVFLRCWETPLTDPITVHSLVVAEILDLATTIFWSMTKDFMLGVVWWETLPSHLCKVLSCVLALAASCVQHQHHVLT